MNNAIFREKSIQKVQSPDNLNEYIRVSNPGIWILMVSIAFLLVGLCIWGCFGQLHTQVQGQARCENGVVSFLLPENNAAGVQPGMTAQLGGQTGGELSLHLGGDGEKVTLSRNNRILWEGEAPDGDGPAQGLRLLSELKERGFVRQEKGDSAETAFLSESAVHIPFT